MKSVHGGLTSGRPRGTPAGGPRERCPFFGHDLSGSSTPRSKAELLNDGTLEEVQFTGEGARAKDLRLRLMAYLREP